MHARHFFIGNCALLSFRRLRKKRRDTKNRNPYLWHRSELEARFEQEGNPGGRPGGTCSQMVSPARPAAGGITDSLLQPARGSRIGQSVAPWPFSRKSRIAALCPMFRSGHDSQRLIDGLCNFSSPIDDFTRSLSTREYAVKTASALPDAPIALPC